MFDERFFFFAICQMNKIISRRLQEERERCRVLSGLALTLRGQPNSTQYA